jgi:NADH-quinone oxidoreductase subunit A
VAAAWLGPPHNNAPANVAAVSAPIPPAFVMTRRIGTSGIARLHDGTIACRVNVEDRRTWPPCALLCTALRVAAFDLRCESAGFCGKSAPRRFSLPSGGKTGGTSRDPPPRHIFGPSGHVQSCMCRGRPRKGLLMSQSIGQLLAAYIPLIVFVGLSAAIGLVLLLSAFLVAYKQPDPEKLSAYECGFNAFDDARMKFDVRFYLVAILFIIFDLEVTFLFPWAVSFGRVGLYGFWAMMLFLAVLTIGFIYEWKKGALEWD